MVENNSNNSTEDSQVIPNSQQAAEQYQDKMSTLRRQRNLVTLAQGAGILATALGGLFTARNYKDELLASQTSGQADSNSIDMVPFAAMVAGTTISVATSVYKSHLNSKMDDLRIDHGNFAPNHLKDFFKDVRDIKKTLGVEKNQA